MYKDCELELDVWRVTHKHAVPKMEYKLIQKKKTKPINKKPRHFYENESKRKACLWCAPEASTKYKIQKNLYMCLCLCVYLRYTQ